MQGAYWIVAAGPQNATDQNFKGEAHGMVAAEETEEA